MNCLLSTLLLAASLSAQAQYRSQVWSPDNGDGTYTNPVINADYSDPDVCVGASGRDYYLTASSFQCTPGLPILHSRDLVNWRIVGHALKELTPAWEFHGTTTAHGKGVWAPCIRYHAGYYYIYWGDPDHGVYMVRTQDPEGEWEKPVLVIEGKGMIDTTPLWDDDGRCYLANAWAGSRAGFNSVLTVRELSPDGTRAIGRPVLVFDGGNDNHTVEGPKFYKRDGWYWLMAPAGGVSQGWQLAMRSRSPYGPYECRKVMEQGPTAFNGPHQGGWVHTAEGEDWFMNFQDKGAYGRVVHLQPMRWADGWPVIGEAKRGAKCGNPVATWRKPTTGGDVQVENPVESDEFNEPRLGLQWQWQANYDQLYGQPTPNGYFRLYTHFVDSQDFHSLWDAPNLLLQKTPADAFTATAKVRLAARREGQYGGLVMMGRSYSALVVRRVGDKFQLQQLTCVGADQSRAERVTVLATLSPTEKDKIPYSPAIYMDVYLRLTVREGAKMTFAYSLNGKCFTPCGDEFQMKEGKWIGAKFGFASMDTTRNTHRGHLDIDWLRVSRNE